MQAQTITRCLIAMGTMLQTITHMQGLKYQFLTTSGKAIAYRQFTTFVPAVTGRYLCGGGRGGWEAVGLLPLVLNL